MAGKPATTQVGPYSVVGLAEVGDSVTRIFANMQPHFSVSVSFNIVGVDLASSTQLTKKELFVVVLDNVIL